MPDIVCGLQKFQTKKQASRLSLAGYAAIRLRNADSNAMVVTGFSNQGADLKISSMSSDSAE